MALPQSLRSLTPDTLRDDIRLRALALGAGLIPPRTMHSDAEAALLFKLARGRHTVVEVGVYEGSSAVRLCRAMSPDADLHLIDPFIHVPTALLPGDRAVERATRRAVTRARRRFDGPRLHWHIALSEDVAREWDGTPVDLVFVDGDHSEAGCRTDWEEWSPHVAPGGVIVFHDARLGREGGGGQEGPTAVVDSAVREAPGWAVVAEVDTMVAAERSAAT